MERYFPKTLFPPLGGDTRSLLEGFPALIDRVFPLPRRFRAGLTQEVAELSRLLTSGRGEREGGYLGKPPLLSAYLRYFLPWNVYRLSRLLPALPLPLAAGDALTDLGSGPLTLPLALWISRPDLRGLRLEFRCLDRIGAALEAGKTLFSALAGKDHPWIIKTIRASLGAPIHGPKAALVTVVNMYNEIPGPPAPGPFADKQARLLSALAREGGSILVVEPGIPRSGEFITALRGALATRDRFPLAPCPHGGPCPLPGGLIPGGRGKAKWCHFAFATEDAPGDLQALSIAAGLPKERAVLSFLLTGPLSAGAPALPDSPLLVRIVSDPFPLPGAGDNGRYGRYGCSAKGLVLAAGTREKIEPWGPGTLLHLTPPSREQRDPKSGALILPAACGV
ncbi:MAG: rRNA methyltransferase [Spirochaetaceae bacterium]|nr:rRNA methyltransferase [Spirochaetaceae bacterium]